MTLQTFILCFCLFAVVDLITGVATPFPRPEIEKSTDYWYKDAVQDLKSAKDNFERTSDRKRAKNVILFIGDGMGIPSVTAGRIMKGQQQGKSGEEVQLIFEKFSHASLIKTYNTDAQTADSAGTATAYLTGSKTISGGIGVNENIILGNCSSYSTEDNVMSFLVHAQKEGKSIGIVTNTRITHATPAAAFSHAAHRDWEDDTDRNKHVPENLRTNCPDIASQIITYGINYNLFFGGGRQKFLPKTQNTTDASGNTFKGTRSDGRNIIDEWKTAQKGLQRKFSYLETLSELEKLDVKNTDYVLGLFAPSHMRYDTDNAASSQKEPSHEFMIKKAIQILERNPKGFALFVEGGRIDHAHHENLAVQALNEVVSFDKAIEFAKSVTDSKETLIIVTADHSHMFSLGAWGVRGNPVTGKTLFSYTKHYNTNGEGLAMDNKTHTVLGYIDGPSAKINAGRDEPVNTSSLKYETQSLINLDYESHGGEDVPLYAQGPGSFLFQNTHEQSYVAHVIMHSLCVGKYKETANCLPADIKSSSSICATVLINVLSFAIYMRMFLS